MYNHNQGEDLESPDVKGRYRWDLVVMKLMEEVCVRNVADWRSPWVQFLSVWWRPHVLQTAESGHQTPCTNLPPLLVVLLSHNSPVHPRSLSELGSLHTQSLSCQWWFLCLANEAYKKSTIFSSVNKCGILFQVSCFQLLLTGLRILIAEIFIASKTLNVSVTNVSYLLQDRVTKRENFFHVINQF